MEQNRRYHERQAMVCRVDFADSQGRAELGLIRDLSMDGLFVEYASNLTVGDTVVTSFALPASPPFKLRAKVVRVTPNGAGLKFERLSALGSSRYPESLEMYCAALYKAWLGHTDTRKTREPEMAIPLEAIPFA